MKKLYEAENGLEAHMIVDLLQQAHLHARVDGEFLQGAVGEIQVSGIVRVMVAEDDYSAAREIIKQWEKKADTSHEEQSIKEKRQSNTWIYFAMLAIGIILGASSTFYYFHAPVNYNGVDHNGDGVRDETWIYKNNRISKTLIDRNFDGEIDQEYSYSRYGNVKYSDLDENFDGVYETKVEYENGSPVALYQDTTGDGFNDYQSLFKFGVLWKSYFISPSTKNIIKVQYFHFDRIEKEEVDTDGDGILDTVFEYDEVENLVGTYEK